MDGPSGAETGWRSSILLIRRRVDEEGGLKRKVCVSVDGHHALSFM